MGGPSQGLSANVPVRFSAYLPQMRHQVTPPDLTSVWPLCPAWRALSLKFASAALAATGPSQRDTTKLLTQAEDEAHEAYL